MRHPPLDTIEATAEDVPDSRALWDTLKSEEGADYTYSRGSSSWVGFWSQTTIAVRDDRVVERSYLSGDSRDQELPPSWWTETSSSIGSHEQGAPALTIEELYDICIEEVLVQAPAENDFSVRLFDNGILSSCSYRAMNCADDCSRGFGLRYFQWD